MTEFDIRKLDADDVDAVDSLRRNRSRQEALRFETVPSVCEVLRFNGETVAIRVFSIDEGKVLSVHLGRVTHRAHDRLVAPYFVMAFVYKAAETGKEVIVIHQEGVSDRLAQHYGELGFVESEGKLVRFCIPAVLRREEVLSRMESLRPGASRVFSAMDQGELEGRCSPLCLTDLEQKFLIIPIRPGYAVNIVDFTRSASELFGGEPSRLLRPDNVYYRSARTFTSLKPPARILWYVSEDRLIAGSSRLDCVEVGPAKEIFRKYQKRGTLNRRAVVEIAKGDPEGEVMALSFSDTHPFPRRVFLDEIRKVYSDLGNGNRFLPMTVRTVPADFFHELFRRGHQAGGLPGARYSFP